MRETYDGGVAPVVKTAEAPGHVVIIGSLRVKFFNPRQWGCCCIKINIQACSDVDPHKSYADPQNLMNVTTP